MSDCQSGRCEVGANPSRNFKYVWRCSNDKCRFVVPINDETYRLFFPTLRCPKCANGLICYPEEWIKKERESLNREQVKSSIGEVTCR